MQTKAIEFPTRQIFLLLFLMLASGIALAANTLYVQSAKAKLLAAPSFGGEVLAVAQKGEELIFIKKDKSWLQVEYQGQMAWVSKLLVSEQPPTNKVSHLGDANDNLVGKNVRKRASTVATAGAARGLTSDNRSRANASMASDYSELAEMEKISIDPTDVDAFMQMVVDEGG